MRQHRPAVLTAAIAICALNTVGNVAMVAWGATFIGVGTRSPAVDPMNAPRPGYPPWG